MRAIAYSFVLLAAVPVSAVAAPPPPKPAPSAQAPGTLQVTSSAFRDTEQIPPEFTCDGGQKAPPLAWSGTPDGTKSIAIFVDDPDASKGTYTHWLVTGLPATTTSVAAGGTVPEGAAVAKNGKGATGYTGPCPTSGRHRYMFHVFALDAAIAPPVGKADLLREMSGHILAHGQLVGTYSRLTTP